MNNDSEILIAINHILHMLMRCNVFYTPNFPSPNARWGRVTFDILGFLLDFFRCNFEKICRQGWILSMIFLCLSNNFSDFLLLLLAVRDIIRVVTRFR